MNSPEVHHSPRITRRFAGIMFLSICVGLTWGVYRWATSESRLIAGLRDANPEVRRHAAGTLGEVKDPRAVEPLIAALKDADAKVRFYAAGALAKLNDPRAVEPLIATLRDADSTVNSGAALALRDIGAPAVQPLMAALKDENPEVRRRVAWVLGDIKDPRAVEPLIAALEDDADSIVRWNSATALQEIGTPAPERMLPALRERDLAVVAKAYPFFIVRAEPGSEEVLAQALNAHGTLEMAMDYLNCGNGLLGGAAQRWAKAHGYSEVSIPGFGEGGGHWGGRR
jgi:HEAT repeat protein